MINIINGEIFCGMLMSAANNLCNYRQVVDSMNVFPVPDGDTGSNMSMTITACVKAVEENRDKSLPDITKLAANAALRGARGNSGVILSQLIRGMQKSLAGVDEADCRNIAAAFRSAADSAYRAVMKPTEGTILTVARMMAEAAEAKAAEYEDAAAFLEYITDAGNKALAKTPQLLPQLKQAGVVDSGGQGLMYLIEGALHYLKNGEIISANETSAEETASEAAETASADIKFAYCTECIIEKKDSKADTFKFKTTIEMIGDSMVVVDDEEIIKVHIHTNNPDVVLSEALKLGELSNVKIENMKLQHSNIIKEKESSEPETPAEPPKKYGFAAVAAGEGIADTFTQLGVDRIIQGGQTMNPSTDDILNVIESINAENVVVFPNNKNIIMAAEQARDISKKNVIVIPTKSITQAVTCMLAYDEAMEPSELEEEMSSAKDNAVSAQITFAVRDTTVDGMEIHDGDILGIVEGKIKYVDKTVHDSALNIIKGYANDDTSLITLFYGSDTTEEEADALSEAAEELFPDVEFSVIYGGQPVYNYYISIE
ncbi:MAG: DAK2 domain-containing protein [Clostridia bacterium]|nr:DAK2 domain-containing protein [Clostridia bacterium]